MNQTYAVSIDEVNSSIHPSIHPYIHSFIVNPPQLLLKNQRTKEQRNSKRNWDSQVMFSEDMPCGYGYGVCSFVFMFILYTFLGSGRRERKAERDRAWIVRGGCTYVVLVVVVVVEAVPKYEGSTGLSFRRASFLGNPRRSTVHPRLFV